MKNIIIIVLFFFILSGCSNNIYENLIYKVNYKNLIISPDSNLMSFLKQMDSSRVFKNYKIVYYHYILSPATDSAYDIWISSNKNFNIGDYVYYKNNFSSEPFLLKLDNNIKIIKWKTDSTH